MTHNQEGHANIEFMVAIALICTGLSLALPEMIFLAKGKQQLPSINLWLGSIISAVGVWGVAVLRGPPETFFQLILLIALTLFGIGLCAGTALGVIYSPEWWRKLLFVVAVPPPLVGPVRIWVMLVNAGRKSRR